MAQITMYPGINNSPKATLTAGITASDQIIPISNGAFFPAGPGLATIGVEDDAEVVRYAAVSGNTLTGCERGFYGSTAKVWNQNDVIYRGFALYDHDAFKANITDLATNKLDKTGDGSNVTSTFAVASSRTNIATGEKTSVLFGKVAKWFADLKAMAFKASVATGDIDAAAVTNAKMSNMAAKTLKGNSTANAAVPADISAADVRTMLNVSDGADVTRTVAEGVLAIDAIADADKLLLNDASAVAGSQTKYVLWSAIKTLLNALYASITHASRHKSGGADPLTAADIGAADSTHGTRHGSAGDDPVVFKWEKALTASGWVGGVQDISITVTENNVVFISGATDADKTKIANAGIGVAHVSGGLRFTATTTPSSNISINIAAV